LATDRTRRLTIPIETVNRELDAKVLLACVAAERGFTSLLGPKRLLHRRMGSLPRSLYLAKSVTEGNALAYHLLQNLGHYLVCGDEESIVYYSAEWYAKEKIGDGAFPRARALLGWGPEIARVWREHPTYRGARIHVTGNPRTDFLRPELRDFFAPEAEALRERFGAFALINSNFGDVNHYVAWRSIEDPETDAAVEDFETGLARHRAALFRGFLELVPALADAFPDRNIVIRPHPSEGHEAWGRAAGGRANVHVVHEGSVIPWLMAARATIHNGCTTGIESYVLGKTPIAYRPATSERFDLHLPNNLSHQTFDLEGAVELVGAAFSAQGIPFDRATAAVRRKLLGDYVAAAVDGPLAAERVVSALEEEARIFASEPGPGLGATLSGRYGALRRALKKRLKRRRDVARYHAHKFPDLSIAAVQTRIDGLRRVLGRFSDVEAREVSHNVFEIRSPRR
jgi:surface carbohydrate biosynthesis protein